MAYYLGRDVKVYLTTESPEAQVDVSGFAVSAISAGGASVAATATFTFGDTEFDDDDEETITLIDGVGLSKTYKIMTGYDADSTAQEFNTGATATAAAANFEAIVESSNGHNGSITVSVVAGAVTITQVTTGTAGNTTIAHSSGWDAICDVNVGDAFTGGDSDPDFSAATTFAENLDQTAISLTRLADLTGVDLGIGVTDEDVTFMGSKTVLKAEIKKETTISLTRKKSNNVWDVVYNGPTAANEGWTGTAAEEGDYGARWGVIEGAAEAWYIMNGLSAPKNVTDFGGTAISFGYRVFIQIGTSEIIAIPGCQLTAHSVTLNADGTTEETCELISQVTPKIGSTLAAVSGRLTASDM